MRVLVMAHSHPRLTHGGAELAAYRLYQGLAARDGVAAWFLGADTRPDAGRDGVAITQPFGAGEYVYSPAAGRFDWFRFANADARLPGELSALLRTLAPDIVHLHHYAQLGVETLLTIRRALPDARILVTLHEYLAICHHFGQMVKTGAKAGRFALCGEASPAACHGCFPAIDQADFALRERYIKLFLGLVDRFVAPSRFLLERYAAWGIERARLVLLENVTAAAADIDHAEPARTSLRVGFFGQISPLKGIGVLLDAAAILARRPRLSIGFVIHGDPGNQPEAFQEEFAAQLAAVPRNVTYRGAYRQVEVDRLMRGVDAVLVPSVWWENAPVVIEEALRNRRPVICSDIGGMAEKVRDGIDGWHVPVGSATALAELLAGLSRDRAALRRVQASLRMPTPPDEVVEAHRRLYAELRAMPAAA